MELKQFDMSWVWIKDHVAASPTFDSREKAFNWHKEMCQYFHQFKCNQ